MTDSGRAYRAERARRVIRGLRRNMGAYRNDERKITPEDVVDILTDIRHLCDRFKWDCADLNRRAGDHYDEEREGR